MRRITDSGCWEWTGALTKGYGNMLIGGRGGRKVAVHRVAYTLLVGPVPEGLDLDHLCRNRACFNPAHLEPVTRRENLLRGIGHTATRATQTHCVNGHEFTPESTYIRTNGTRRCRPCSRDLDKRRSRRKRAA